MTDREEQWLNRLLQELRHDLNAAAEILSSVGETFWSSKLRDMADRVWERPRLVGELETWFGGMGSLNDVYLCRHNGHKVEEMEEAAVNGRLRAVLGRIYANANDMRRWFDLH
jgi:hypothetical protein